MGVSRQVEAIDLYKLYAKGSNNGWNEFLTECHLKHDVHRMARMRYALQAGMDDLVKKKLNSDEIDKWFFRLQKSLENTMKRILKEKYPTPLDNVHNVKEYGAKKWKDVKKLRDEEFEAFLRKTGY